MNPTGAHPVGVADVTATLVGPGVNRIAARLFYPCQRTWTVPCTWIPHVNYARGYIGYLFKLVAKKTWKSEIARSALISIAWALGGSRVLPVFYNAPAATPAAAPGPLPIVIFSHGLAGTRNAYSSICIELASRGYVVMALEHGDGSASCARLPRLPKHVQNTSTSTTTTTSETAAARGAAAPAASSAVTDATATAATVADSISSNINSSNAAVGDGEDAQRAGVASRAFEDKGEKGNAGSDPGIGYRAGSGSGRAPSPGAPLGSEWCFYGGLGDKKEQLRKTQYRVAEVAAAFRLMEVLQQRGSSNGKSSTGEGDACASPAIRELPVAVADSLRGRLDLGRAVVAGHSYGGATAAAAAASLPFFRAAVSLDPWWDCYDDSWPVLHRWVNPQGAPLLVIGSDDWNTPNAEGKLKCGGVNQERVLEAAAAGGGGAVLAVPRGSTHTNFDDVMLLFGKSLSALLRLLGMRTSLAPRMAHRINMWCITHFLDEHVPPRPPLSTPSAPPPRLPLAQQQLQQQQLQQQGQQQEAPLQQRGSAHGTAAAAPERTGPSDPPVGEAGETGKTAEVDSTEGVASTRPVKAGDLAPFQEQWGDWLAILRLVPGRGRSGA